MTTLRLPKTDDLAPEDGRILESAARRMGTTVDHMSVIWRAQAYWPRCLCGHPAFQGREAVASHDLDVANDRAGRMQVGVSVMDL
jgi:hypothetical protein